MSNHSNHPPGFLTPDARPSPVSRPSAGGSAGSPGGRLGAASDEQSNQVRRQDRKDQSGKELYDTGCCDETES